MNQPIDARRRGTAGSLFRAENLFLALALVFGLVLVFVNPPLHGPDEWNHFYRAYHVSAGKMFAERDDVSGLVGGWMPVDIVVMEKSIFFDLPYSPEEKERILYFRTEDPDEYRRIETSSRKDKKRIIFSLLEHPLSSSYGEDAFMSFPNTALYPPVVYMPQAVAMSALRMLEANAILLIYGGRILNLLFWAAIVYLAIRTAPVFKHAFLVLALSPTSLFQASSLSADVLTNGISFLFVALVLTLVFGQRQKADNVRLAVILVLAVLICLCKFYVFVPLLLLAAPVESYGSRKRAYLLAAITLAAMLSVLSLWMYVIRDLHVELMPGVDTGEQARFIITSPGKFVAMIFTTLAEKSTRYITEFFGTLGHFGPTLPIWFAALYAFVLVGTVAAEHLDGPAIHPGQRGIALASFLLGGLLLLTLQYLKFTAVGSAASGGMQGRHLIPLAPALFITGYSRSFRLRQEGVLYRLLETAFIGFSLCYAVTAIVNAYYP